jgi:hypothetical protein
MTTLAALTLGLMLGGLMMRTAAALGATGGAA